MEKIGKTHTPPALADSHALVTGLHFME